MSVFGKIATGSPAGMTALIHIHVDDARVERTAAYRRRNDVLSGPFDRDSAGRKITAL